MRCCSNIRSLSAVLILFWLLLAAGCSKDFLEITPNGSLDEAVLATYEGVDALLIGAYSMIDGVTASHLGWGSTTSGWVFGSIRGLEANKGTDSGDSSPINPIQTYSERATNDYLNMKWRSVYEGVSRCNSTVLAAKAALKANSITINEYETFYQQARVLRGFYHFEAWRLWADQTTNRFVPYVDEFTDQSTLTNTEDIRDRIIEDLKEGTKLPNDMGQVGRFNRTVSQVFLAKALMQMYDDYPSALKLLEEVISTGTNPVGQQPGLEPCYGDIFDIENRNGPESIYTVQYSVNDGSGGWTSGWMANGYRMIRFADVLLLKAECEAETKSDDLGLGEVNAIRVRAANPEGFVKEDDGLTHAANYLIAPYPAFADWRFALKAIRFERKLELGQEGHRYYDLQRWRQVYDELNRILEYEKTMEWGSVSYGYSAVGLEDVNFPIPQRQIDLHDGRLIQNR